MNNHYPFLLPELPYEYNALEPYIDEETMKIHHDKHLKAYIDNLNNTLENCPKYQCLSLESLIKISRRLPALLERRVRNNAGGVYNHLLYFDILKKDGAPISDNLKDVISRDFNSYENFIEKFKKCSLDVFGSGYCFLAVDRYGKLKIICTQNQDTPFALGLYPILLIDVWEHAYYLKYQNRRGEYIDNFMKIINWQKVNDYYESYMNIIS